MACDGPWAPWPMAHNLRPEKEYALGPLDMSPAGIADAADWRNLIFGGWWSWLEKWGKMVSIFLGVYYLYVVGRWLLTTLFSLRILYQEHGFNPNLLWGLGPGQDVFPMRFYRQWRRFKQHFEPEDSRRGLTPLPLPRDYEPLRPRVPPHHEYLTVHEAERPSLPSRNVYPPLPSSDRSSISSSAGKQKVYQPAAYASGQKPSAGPTLLVTPPAADSWATVPALGPVSSVPTISAPEATQSRPAAPRGAPDSLLPTYR